MNESSEKGGGKREALQIYGAGKQTLKSLNGGGKSKGWWCTKAVG